MHNLKRLWESVKRNRTKKKMSFYCLSFFNHGTSTRGSADMRWRRTVECTSCFTNSMRSDDTTNGKLYLGHDSKIVRIFHIALFLVSWVAWRLQPYGMHQFTSDYCQAPYLFTHPSPICSHDITANAVTCWITLTYHGFGSYRLDFSIWSISSLWSSLIQL